MKMELDEKTKKEVKEAKKTLSRLDDADYEWLYAHYCYDRDEPESILLDIESDYIHYYLLALQGEHGAIVDYESVPDTLRGGEDNYGYAVYADGTIVFAAPQEDDFGHDVIELTSEAIREAMERLGYRLENGQYIDEEGNRVEVITTLLTEMEQIQRMVLDGYTDYVVSCTSGWGCDFVAYCEEREKEEEEENEDEEEDEEEEED